MLRTPHQRGLQNKASRVKPEQGEYQPRTGNTSREREPACKPAPRDSLRPSWWLAPSAPVRHGTLGQPVGKRSPILGYNHNVRYRGLVFHVQTEDSGVASPHLFTHLFHTGVI